MYKYFHITSRARLLGLFNEYVHVCQYDCGNVSTLIEIFLLWLKYFNSGENVSTSVKIFLSRLQGCLYATGPFLFVTF